MRPPPVPGLARAKSQSLPWIRKRWWPQPGSNTQELLSKLHMAVSNIAACIMCVPGARPFHFLSLGITSACRSNETIRTIPITCPEHTGACTRHITSIYTAHIHGLHQRVALSPRPPPQCQGRSLRALEGRNMFSLLTFRALHYTSLDSAFIPESRHQGECTDQSVI